MNAAYVTTDCYLPNLNLIHPLTQINNQMKELKHIDDQPIIQTHYPLPRRNKKWVIAQSRGTNKQQEVVNFCTENAYHRIVKTVKERYLSPTHIYFERDYKTDQSEGLNGMHSFVTPEFYFRLDCHTTYDFEVEFAFNDCPYEAEIRALLAVFPLDTRAKEKVLQPNFNAIYKWNIENQEACYLYSLKGY